MIRRSGVRTFVHPISGRRMKIGRNQQKPKGEEMSNGLNGIHFDEVLTRHERIITGARFRPDTGRLTISPHVWADAGSPGRIKVLRSERHDILLLFPLENSGLHLRPSKNGRTPAISSSQLKRLFPAVKEGDYPAECQRYRGALCIVVFFSENAYKQFSSEAMRDGPVGRSAPIRSRW